jgi:polyhydroxyalkanoate synthesis regulator phasin
MFNMDSSESSIKAAEDRKVPDDLLQRLHAANQQLHQAKQVMEQVLADSELDHQKRVEAAEEQFRIAERDVEKITMEIQGALKPPAAEQKH